MISKLRFSMLVTDAIGSALAGCVGLGYGTRPDHRQDGPGECKPECDGIPDRQDCDRTGDRVPNRMDSRPKNPNCC